jgi:DNA polymerase I-like protein with 3'-5' exonuclease and polymerase domains
MNCDKKQKKIQNTKKHLTTIEGSGILLLARANDLPLAAFLIIAARFAFFFSKKNMYFNDKH